MDNKALPDMMEIDGRLDKHKELANVDVAAELEASTGVEEPLDVSVKGPVVAQPIPKLIITIQSTDKPSTRQSLSNQFFEVSVGRDASLPEQRRNYSSFARGRR